MAKDITLTKEEFDPLDMNNYRIEKLPKRARSKTEKILSNIGGPLAVILFLLFYFVLKPAFLLNINVDSLSDFAAGVYKKVGSAEFTRINLAMMAIFIGAVVLWITEAIPNIKLCGLISCHLCLQACW